jgi:hypothetical protein
LWGGRTYLRTAHPRAYSRTAREPGNRGDRSHVAGFMASRPFRPPFPWVRVSVVAGLAALLGGVGYGCMMHMPGESASPPLPALSAEEEAARPRLRRDVHELAAVIGERNTRRPEALERAAVYLEEQLRSMGYSPARQTYSADGQPCSNLEAAVAGRGAETVVVGAHYDSAIGSPGANDNGSGVAVLLELGRRLKGDRPERAIRWVLFVNEEPPFFHTSKMGSRVWAEAAHARGETITAMLSLETMGFYTGAPESQKYPFPMGAFYPDQGHFLGFIANIDSGDLARASVGTFREVATLPSEGAALPERTIGVDWSDHASFWRHGWQAVMVTDTAPFRYPHYHTTKDLPEQVDDAALARAVTGLVHVVRRLSGSGPSPAGH